MGVDRNSHDNVLRYPSSPVPFVPVVMEGRASRVCFPERGSLFMRLVEDGNFSFPSFQWAVYDSIFGVAQSLFYCNPFQRKDALDRIFATWEPLVLRSLNDSQFFHLFRQWEELVIRAVDEAKRCSPSLEIFYKELGRTFGEALNVRLTRRRQTFLGWFSQL